MCVCKYVSSIKALYTVLNLNVSIQTLAVTLYCYLPKYIDHNVNDIYSISEII